MKIGSVNQLLGNFNTLKNKSEAPQKKKTESPTLFDKVDISTPTGQESAVGIAKSAFHELQTSLINSLNQGSDKDSASTLLLNTANSFINNQFSALESPAKSEFAKLFQTHSNQPGGILTQDLIKNSFGDTDGFAKTIQTISNSLNQYL